MGDVRIIAGRFKNRKVVFDDRDGLRPSSAKVRGAMFSSLGPSACQGAKVIDLYAGSGVLGLEAWSRGAQSITWVDQDAKSIENIRRHTTLWSQPNRGERLQLRFSVSDVGIDIQRVKKRSIDIAFMDPPYALHPSSALWEALENLLTNNGVILYESDAKAPVALPESLVLTRQKRYGQSLLRTIEKKN